MPLTMSARDARKLVYGGDFSDMGLEVVSNEQIGSSRWESIHEVVVRDSESNFWMTGYRQGLTEYQDSRPFEDDSEVTFLQVEPVQVTVTQYRPLAG